MLIKKILGVASAKIVAIPLSLLVTVVTARLLGVDGFSEYTLVLGIASILSLPVSGGLNQLLTREIAIAKYSLNFALCRGLILSALIWIVLSVVILSVGYWRILSFLPSSVDLQPKFGLTVLVFFFASLNLALVGLYRGLHRPSLVVVNDELLRPASFLVMILFLFNLRPASGSNEVLAIHATAMAISTLLFFVCLIGNNDHNVGSCREVEFKLKEWMQALIPLIVIGMVYTLSSNIGVVITGFLGEKEDVAGLRIADRAVQLVSMPLLIVNMVMAPYFATKWKTYEYMELQRLITLSSWGAFFVSVPIALILWFFGENIIGMFFGDEYSNISYLPLSILLFGQVLNVGFGSVGFLLIMTGNERYSLAGQSLGLVINVFLAIVLVPKYGAVGAAISISAGLVAWNLVLGAMVKKHLGLIPGVFSMGRS